MEAKLVVDFIFAEHCLGELNRGYDWNVLHVEKIVS